MKKDETQKPELSQEKNAGLNDPAAATQPLTSDNTIASNPIKDSKQKKLTIILCVVLGLVLLGFGGYMIVVSDRKTDNGGGTISSGENGNGANAGNQEDGGTNTTDIFTSDDVYAYAIYGADNNKKIKIYAMKNDGTKEEICAFSEGEVIRNKTLKSVSRGDYYNGKLYLMMDFVDPNSSIRTYQGIYSVNLLRENPRTTLTEIYIGSNDYEKYEQQISRFFVDDGLIILSKYRADDGVYKYLMNDKRMIPLNLDADLVSVDREKNRILLISDVSENNTISYYSVDYDGEDKQMIENEMEWNSDTYELLYGQPNYVMMANQKVVADPESRSYKVGSETILGAGFHRGEDGKEYETYFQLIDVRGPKLIVLNWQVLSDIDSVGLGYYEYNSQDDTIRDIEWSGENEYGISSMWYVEQD